MPRRAAMTAMIAATAACVWDEGGPRLQEPCKAELDRCIDVCEDRSVGRANADLATGFDDQFTCEPRCHERFQRCLEERTPAGDDGTGAPLGPDG